MLGTLVFHVHINDSRHMYYIEKVGQLVIAFFNYMEG